MKIEFKNIVNFFLVSSVLGVSISYGKIYLFHLALLILILSFLIFKVNTSYIQVNKLYTKKYKVFFVMLFWYFASFFWSIKLEYSIIYVLYILCGLSIVMTMLYTVDENYKLSSITSILGKVFLIEIVFCLLEAFTSFRLPISPYSKYLKFFGRTHNDLDLFFEESVLANIMQSPTGFQWNPNNLAVTMLIIFPFFLFYKNFKVKLFGVFSIATIIIMTGSRGVFIALVFMLAMYYLFFKVRTFFFFLFAAPLVIFMSLSQIDQLKASENAKIRDIAESFEVLQTYLFEQQTISDGSIGARQELMRNGFEALEETYYLGVGGGASNAVQEIRGGHSLKYTSMHNFWAEILVDSGVLFFLLFFMWYVSMCVKLYKISKLSKDQTIIYTSKALFLSFVAFSVGAVSASSAIYLFPMWIMYGLAIAVINIHNKNLKNESLTTFRL